MQILSPRYHLKGEVNSMQGGRPENQDNFGFQETPLGFLVVVCDGMGGGPAGRQASRIVADQVLAFIGHSSADADRREVMRQAAAMAEQTLQDHMVQHPEWRGMGTTMVALLVSAESAVVAHVGDSRAYRFSGKKMAFRTEDHSLVAQLVRNKTFTEEQARTSPQSNVITRAFGNTDNHVADIDVVPYCRGDRFVLCTDGVWAIMPAKDLQSRLTANEPVDQVAAHLTAEVDKIGFAAGGGHDNHTLVVIETETSSKLKDKMNLQAKIIIAVLTCLLMVSVVFNLLGACADGQSAEASAADQQGDLVKQVAEMQVYKARYDSLLNAKLDDYSGELEWLMVRDAEQSDSIVRLNEAIAALKARMQQAAEQNSASLQSLPAGAVTPKGYATKVLECLQKMKDVKSKTPKDGTEQKAAYRRQIMELLDALDKASADRYAAYTKSIRGMVNDVRKKDGKVVEAACMRISGEKNKEGVHYSPKKSNEAIDLIIKKVNELIAKL